MLQYFKINSYPNDVYNAVGQIIKSAQEWEEAYKKLAAILCIPNEKIDNSSLNKLNEALKKNHFISEKDFENMKKVIKIRNYINHTFYLTDFRNEYGSYEEKIQKLTNILNDTQFLIFEATDVIDNMIDELEGKTTMRPTIFD